MIFFICVLLSLENRISGAYLRKTLRLTLFLCAECKGSEYYLFQNFTLCHLSRWNISCRQWLKIGIEWSGSLYLFKTQCFISHINFSSLYRSSNILIGVTQFTAGRSSLQQITLYEATFYADYRKIACKQHVMRVGSLSKFVYLTLRIT